MNLLKPSETKLGDNKIVGRDYQILWGLFRPSKYGINDLGGYNVSRFGKHFTELSLIKHRDGEADISVGMFFHGVTNKFIELPEPYVVEGSRKVENPQLREYYV